MQRDGHVQDAADNARNELARQLPSGFMMEVVTATCPGCGQELTRGFGDKLFYGWGRWSDCQCVENAKSRAATEFSNAHRQRFVDAIWADTNVPKHFRASSFGTFERTDAINAGLAYCEEYARAFDPESTATGILLVGRSGTGKTSLAVATARAIAEQHLVQPLFYSSVTLVDDFLRGGNGRIFNYDAIDRTVAAELLILDDLGQECVTERSGEVLFRVIEYRYREERPTIFTSNYGVQQLRDHLGTSITSRIVERAAPVLVDGEDYRRQLAERRLGERRQPTRSPAR